MWFDISVIRGLKMSTYDFWQNTLEVAGGRLWSLYAFCIAGHASYRSHISPMYDSYNFVSWSLSKVWWNS